MNIVADNILLMERLGAIPVESPTEEYLNYCCTRIREVKAEYQDDDVYADLYKDDKSFKLFCVLYDAEWERIQAPVDHSWKGGL